MPLMELDTGQLAAAAAEFEASDGKTGIACRPGTAAPESPLTATPMDLLPALIQDREATVLRTMEEEPIDYADLESVVASAGRFRLELSPTLDAANGRLIEWRKTSLRSMWEFADVAYFFRCFHTDELLHTLPKCDTSDLERLLLDTSSNGLAGTLHIALMKLVWPRVSAREDNWFRLLLNNLSATEGLVEGSWTGALKTMLINEEEDGKIATDLPPNHSNQTIQNKMMLLHALVHLVFDTKHPGVMAVIQENPDSWRMQPACWYVDEATKVRHAFYYFTDIEVGCLLGEHWEVEVDDASVEIRATSLEDDSGGVEDPAEEEHETLDDADSSHEHDVSPEVLPKKRAGSSVSKKRGKKKSIFSRPDSDSDTDEEIPVEDEPTIATVSLGGRVRKQTQHFQPQQAPKTKKSRTKASSREGVKGARGGRGRGRGKGRGGGRARGGRGRSKGRAAAARKNTTNGNVKSSRKNAKPSKPPPKMESRWKTHAVGLDELEGLLFSEGLDHDVATMIKEVWLPEGQQKLKQRQRQSRRVNAQLKALSFGDSGGFGDPLGVEEASSGGSRRRRTAVNYSEAAYDQQINEAIRESNREYRRGGGSSASPHDQQPARKRGMRTTRQGRGMGDEIQEVVDKILSSGSSGSDRSEVLEHILTSLQKKDPDNIFANPVDTTLVFDYLEVVTEPMDLGTMSSKVKARSYHSCAAFERDLALVVSNCRAYNEQESIYCAAATELESWGARLFEHLRNNDMLPPDDPTGSSDDDDELSSSTSSVSEDEGHMVAGKSMTAPVDAGMSTGARATAAGWRQSATAFLHDRSSGNLTTAADAAGQANIATNDHGGISIHSEDSSVDSSDDEGGHVAYGKSASSTAPDSSFATNAGGWRQSTTAFLHDRFSGDLATAADAAGQANIATNDHGGSSIPSEDSSVDSNSSDDDAGHVADGKSACSAAPDSSFVGGSAPASVADHGLPRFTLGPKTGSASAGW